MKLSDVDAGDDQVLLSEFRQFVALSVSKAIHQAGEYHDMSDKTGEMIPMLSKYGVLNYPELELLVAFAGPLPLPSRLKIPPFASRFRCLRGQDTALCLVFPLPSRLRHRLFASWSSGPGDPHLRGLRQGPLRRGTTKHLSRLSLRV